MEKSGSVSPDHHNDGCEGEVIILEEDFSDDIPSPKDDAQAPEGSGSNSETEVLEVPETQPDKSAADVVVKFTCPFCPEELGEKERWADHVAKSHEARAPTVCYICVRSFSTALGMNLHFSKEHPGDTLRPEFVADGVAKEDRVPASEEKVSAMASFYSNLDAAIPKKGACRKIVIRRPAPKSASAHEDIMERPARLRNHSLHASGGHGSFKPRKPYTRRDMVNENYQAPVKIRGQNVVGAEYDEIQNLIHELEPIPSQSRVGNDSKNSIPMTRSGRRTGNRLPSTSTPCPSCGAKCENEGLLQIHMFERHDLLWCQRCKLKANEADMTEHLTRKHGINKTASYSFLVEWNGRGADEDDQDSGNDRPINVRTSNADSCDDISDSDEISIVFDNLVE